MRRTRVFAAMAAILTGCQQRGLLPFSNFNRIHVVPPLTISVDDLDQGITILDEVLAAVPAEVHA